MDNLEMEKIAELQVRRQMNELFENALPRIIQAAFAAHNSDVDAHQKQFASHQVGCPMVRWKWITVGLLVGLGILGGAEGVKELLSLLGQ